MIFFWMSAFAHEISFYLHKEVERERWVLLQSHSLQMHPVFPDEVSSRLQKRGESGIELRNMLRWNGDDSAFAEVEQMLREDSAVEWVFVRDRVKPPPPIETPDFLSLQEYLYPSQNIVMLDLKPDNIGFCSQT